MNRRLLIALGLVAFGVMLLLQPAPVDPDEKAVFDLTEMLDDPAEARIQQICADLTAETKVPVALLTVESAAQAGRGFTRLDQFTESLIQRRAYYDTVRGREWNSGIVIVFSRIDPWPSLGFGSGWTEEQQRLIEEAVREPIASACPSGACSYAEAVGIGIDALQSVVRQTEPPVLSYAGKFVRAWRDNWRKFTQGLRNPWAALGFFKWVVLFFVAWELIRPWRKKQAKLRRGIWVDVFYTIFNSFLFMAVAGTAICTVSSMIFTDFILETLFGVRNLLAVELNSWPFWLRIPVVIVLIDFIAYWGHRLLHTNDTLWEFHKVHHSAKELDVFNAIRTHFVEMLIYRVLAYIPLGMIGFPAEDALFIEPFRSLFSMFTHANVWVPLGPLKYILNNPQMHIWHHGANYHERGNVNFGDALCMWDFVFGTAYLDDRSDKLVLGIEDNDNYPTTFWGQLVIPFKAIIFPKKKK